MTYSKKHGLARAQEPMPGPPTRAQEPAPASGCAHEVAAQEAPGTGP